MAPEMILMMNQQVNRKTGYTKVIDWWSLGVTMFKMVCGYRPFIDSDFSEFVDMSPRLKANVFKHEKYSNYVKLFQKLDFPEDISDDCKDLISKLLNVDEKRRLGAGRNGPRDIKTHPFFKDIDWVMFENKRIKAPPILKDKYLPEVFDPKKDFESTFPPMCFEDFMAKNRSPEWLEGDVPRELQEYFDEW
jgi:serine/threonine protein kinase